MATTPDIPTGPVEVGVFLAKWQADAGRFHDNDTYDIMPLDLREFALDVFALSQRAAAVLANIPTWSATFNNTGIPAGYPLGFVIRATFAGVEGLHKARHAGQLPAPTSASGDANWLPVAPPAPSTGTIVLRWIEATFALRDGELQPGRWYYILNGGDNFRDVLVQAAAASRFAPTGLLIYPDRQVQDQTVPGALLPALLDVPTSYAEPLREEGISRAALLARIQNRPALIVGKTYAIARPAATGQPAVTVYFSVDRSDGRVCERASISLFPGLYRYDLVNDTLTEVGAATATLYTGRGQNTDGSMTQKATTQELITLNNALDNSVYPLLGLDFRNTYHYSSAHSSQTLLLYTNSVSSFADASDSYQAALTEQPTGSTFADAGMGRALVLSAAAANASAITLKLLNGYKLNGIDELLLAPGQWVIIGRPATSDPAQKLQYEIILQGGTGGGSKTTDASELTSGELDDARLSPNIPRKDAANTFFQGRLSATSFRVPSPDMAGNAEFTVGVDEQNTNSQAVYILPPADARRLFLGSSTRKVFLNLQNVYSIENAPLLSINGILFGTATDGSHAIGRDNNQKIIINATGSASAAFEVRVNNSAITNPPDSPVVFNANQRGILPPRYTTAQRNALVMSADDEGREIHNLTTGVRNIWQQGAWYAPAMALA